MIRSMTGYAEKKFDSKTISVKISIRTLNHRYLDWSCRGNQIGAVENKLRATCQKKLHRGRIEVFISLNFLDQGSWKLRINEDLLREILSSLEKVSSRMHQRASFSVENLFSIPHIVDLTRKDLTGEEVEFLERSFEKVLDVLIKERLREGREIKREIRRNLQNIRKAVNLIEGLAKKQPFLIREKLTERLKKLDQEAVISQEKLAEETAYLAQRYDLTEEIARLKSHLNHSQELLSPKIEEPVGKKLDFVAQELYREANTLNSKAHDIEIIKGSLMIKGEVESIRQQVQNLE